MTDMTEKIGRITLDYSCYPGQDYYCDGQVEDELLEIVKNTEEDDYEEVIAQKKQWPVLYHLSPLRGNIVDWLPVGPMDKVLEVGSGCGAVTGSLADRAGEVTCVDLSRKRSLINAYRHKNCSHVTIHVGNFKDIEPRLGKDYTYIFLIGVFEYSQSYIGGETPYEDFLKKLLPHLAAGGRLVIAIENKYGMKYFAGCREDHLGTYFSGIENYAEGGGARTFGKKGLEEIFRSCGVENYHFYYPYPDYKFMTTLYSDARLPKKGELSDNLRNFDADRMLLFHEKNAFDGVIGEGLFPLFSNSYAVILGEGCAVEYVKYSNDRAPEYRIRTQIEKNAQGIRRVYKYPLDLQAVSHVEALEEAYRRLSERYQGSGLLVNRCTAQGNRCLFEYAEGVPLTEILDGCLERGDEEGFLDWFKKFLEKISYGENCAVADMDPSFSNLLIDGEKWTLIDYEWTARERVSSRDLAYRALYCYLLEDPKRKSLPMERILRELGLDREEAGRLEEKEALFQAHVRGKARSMAQLRDDLGHKVTKPQEWIDRYGDSAQVNRVQIYEDRGEGFSETKSYFVRDAYQGEHLAEFTLEVDGDVKKLRIDPAMDCCIVKLSLLAWNGQAMGRIHVRGGHCRLKGGIEITANGRIAASPADEEAFPSIVFPGTDPNITLCLKGAKKLARNRLSVKMEVFRIPKAVARDLTGK